MDNQKGKGLRSYEFALRISFMASSGTISYTDANSEFHTSFPKEGESTTFTSPSLAGGIGIGGSDIYFGWNLIRFDMNSETQEPNIFLNEDNDPVFIPAGSEVTSETDMEIFSIIWTKDIVSSKRSIFGLGAGLMLIDYSSSYQVEGYTDTGGFGQLFPAPMISLEYTYQVKKLEFQVLAGGVGIKIQGNEIAYLNLDIALRYKLFNMSNWMGMLSVGFKYIPFHLSISNDDFTYQNDMVMAGPFIGFRLRRSRK